MKIFNPLSMTIAISLILAGCASKPTNPTGDFVGTATSELVKSENLSLVVGSRYQVKTGDTVSKIAKDFNVDWRDLSKFNQLDSRHTIYAGQWLNIPTIVPNNSPINQAPLSIQTSSTVVELSTPMVEVNTPPQDTTQQSSPVVPSPVVIQAPTLVASTPAPTVEVAVPSMPSVVVVPEMPLPSPVVVSTPTAPVAPAPIVAPAPVLPVLGLGFAGSVTNANSTPTPAPQTQPTPHFIYPVGQDNLVVKGFGVPIPSGKTEGIFFVGNVGDAIVASETGTVVYANAHPTATNRPMVVIDHNNGYVSTYFDVGAILVKVGDSVKRGDRLGGMTPQTKSGKALFEFRIAQSGRYIDPMGVIKWTVPSGI